MNFFVTVATRLRVATAFVKRHRIKSVVTATVAVPFFLFYSANLLFPLPEPYEGKGFARTVLDSEGKPLRYFADKNGEWRYQIKISQVSPKYIQALIGYEDRFFYKHFGINPASVLRAAVQLVKNGRIISGGSTITMQVARIIDPHKRTFSGKIKQMFRALQLEYYYTKDEILEMYLNLAPFGGNIQGVQAASYTYFDRDISEINHSEAALLAVLPQAPTKLRPDRNPVEAQIAKNKVAKRMAEFGYWDNETVNNVLSEYIYIVGTQRPVTAPLLAERLIMEYPEERVIKTFIVSEIQNHIETLLSQRKYILPEGSSAAVLVVDNSNNNVIAYAGSIEYGNEANFGYIDMVKSIRSPGSTLKPFIYAMAIDNYYIHSQSLLLDTPRIFSTYRAANFYQTFSGAVSAEDALQRSLNVPVVQLLEHLTPEYFYASIRNVGINMPVLGGKPNLSMALGGNGIRLDSLATLYTSLARDGLVYPLKFSELDKVSEERPLFSKEAAYIVYEMLRNQFRGDHIFHHITGKYNKLAWKTGTSYGFRDALAVGVTKKYTIAVWIGRPDNIATPGQYGAITASPVLFNISDYLDQRFPDNSGNDQIQRPDTVDEIDICWPSGLDAKLVVKKDCHKILKALTIQGATPATLTETPAGNNQTFRVEWLENAAGKRVNSTCADETVVLKNAHVWPRISEPWIPLNFRRSGIIPEWDKSCDKGTVLSKGNLIITGVLDRTTLRSGSAKGGLPEIVLSVAGASGTVSWYLNGEFIGETLNNVRKSYKIDKDGTFQLVAVDEDMQTAVVTFYID